ncbi:hypothetical protein [Aquiflexum sp.]|uniref:hypothetical protein n=1 Tax=Aquiflexum sp. TaxID=1872584 RepID=UPI003593A4B8
MTSFNKNELLKTIWLYEKYNGFLIFREVQFCVKEILFDGFFYKIIKRKGSIS